MSKKTKTEEAVKIEVAPGTEFVVGPDAPIRDMPQVIEKMVVPRVWSDDMSDIDVLKALGARSWKSTCTGLIEWSHRLAIHNVKEHTYKLVDNETGKATHVGEIKYTGCGDFQYLK